MENMHAMKQPVRKYLNKLEVKIKLYTCKNIIIIF